MSNDTREQRYAEYERMDTHEHITKILDLEDRLQIAHDVLLSVKDGKLVMSYLSKSVIFDLPDPYPFAMIVLQSVDLLTPDED